MLFFIFLSLSPSSPLYYSKSLLFSFLSSAISPLRQNYWPKGAFLYVCSLMLTILTINFSSVFGFIFPLTTQLNLVMFFSVTFWARCVLLRSWENCSGLLSHLAPEGTALPLCFLLVLIEAISLIIRPITLTVRLVANILAGHVLILLLYKFVSWLDYIPLPLYHVLSRVELVVAVIQSYIFCVLVSLYLREA